MAKKTDYHYALLGIVAIVAIVGVVILIMSSTGAKTSYKSVLPAPSESAKSALAGQASTTSEGGVELPIPEPVPELPIPEPVPEAPIPENNPERRDWVMGVECGGVINEELIEENDGDRDFLLTENLECEGNGIIIDADNVNFICNGNSIIGPGGDAIRDQRRPIYGIYAERVSGISIVGCEISDFRAGIVLNRIEESEIINSIAHNNLKEGIYLEYSNGNTITENRANNNDEEGISLENSDSNTLTRNTAEGNRRRGIQLHLSSSNTLTGNTADGNGIDGIYLFWHSDSNTLIGNTANGNDRYGIHLADSSSENIISDENTAHENGRGGIVFYENTLDNIITRQALACNTP